MKIKTMLVLQQEITETNSEFLDKVERLENSGYEVLDGRCYDTYNQLAEVTLIQNFNFTKQNDFDELLELKDSDSGSYLH